LICVVYLCVFCITRDHEIEHTILSEYGRRGEEEYLTWSFEPDKFLDKSSIAVRPVDSYFPVTTDLKQASSRGSPSNENSLVPGEWYPERRVIYLCRTAVCL